MSVAAWPFSEGSEALPCSALKTCFLVVPFFTCCSTRKCGDSMDLFLKVIVPLAGRLFEPVKRRLVTALTVAEDVGARRGAAGPVTVSFCAGTTAPLSLI